MKHHFSVVLIIALSVGLLAGCVTGPGQGDPLFDLGYAIGSALRGKGGLDYGVYVVPIGTQTPATVFKTYGPRPQPLLRWESVPQDSQCMFRIIDAFSGEVVQRQVWIATAEYLNNYSNGYRETPGKIEATEYWDSIPGQYYIQFWINGVLKASSSFSISSY